MKDKQPTIAAIVIGIAIIGIIVVRLIIPSASPTRIPPTSYTPSASVTYEITGTAQRVNVTLINATGGTEQHSNVIIPGEYRYSSYSDDFVYISAQNQGQSGSVTVSIYVNGNLFKTSTSSGAYVIATASGSI